MTIGETSQQHLAPEKPRDTEVYRPFDPGDTRRAVERASPLGRSVPPDFRYSCLQGVHPASPAEDTAALTETVLKGDALPDPFWFLQVSTHMMGQGGKVKPVACRDIPPRIIGETFRRDKYSVSLQSPLEQFRQYGMNVNGGVEVVV